MQSILAFTYINENLWLKILKAGILWPIFLINLALKSCQCLLGCQSRKSRDKYNTELEYYHITAPQVNKSSYKSPAVSGEASLVKPTVNFSWLTFHHREENVKEWSMEQHKRKEKFAASDLQAAREYNQVKTLRQNSTEQNKLLVFWRRKSVFSFKHSVIAC